MDALLSNADLSAQPAYATPDRALVFELKAPVNDFIRAAQRLGLEWLTEDVPDAPSEEEDSEYTGEDDNGAVLYVTMPSMDGLQRLLALWNRYTSGEARPAEVKEWWQLFGYLRDVRTWSAQDRIDPNLAAYITRMMERQPERPVRVELDLWYRQNPELRIVAREYLEALLTVINGRLLDFVTIDPIQYQAALVEIPAGEARALQAMSGRIANADAVMRVRPQSLYQASFGDEVEAEAAAINAPAIIDDRPAIVALLDGYPVQNHALLANRVDIEEVDVIGAQVPVNRRFHGTAMASLILHGDLSLGDEPLTRALKIIPILAAPQGVSVESTPLERLPIGMVFRAVTALSAGLDGSAPLGNQVVLINHSVCDLEAPFARRPSPWARLLDFLSHKYGVLFVVSAGNIREPFEIDTYVTDDELHAADHIQRQVVLLRSLERTKGARSILSPAESVNALTVGAIHADGAGDGPDGVVDPFSPIGVTNLSSATGLGVNRGIKPDLVEAGGRQVLRSEHNDGVVCVWGEEIPQLGQLVATADPFGLTATKITRSTGTSNAAALVTRTGVKIADILESLFAEDGQDWSLQPTRAVTLKALLAHGCAWRDVFRVLDQIYPPQDARRWARRRESIARFLGYGSVNIDRVVAPEGSRITLLADDIIRHDQRHEYKVPIPRAMIGNRELRRVVTTLAYSSPVDPQSNRYRALALEIVDQHGRRDFWAGVKSVPQPHAEATRRGTLQHLVLEGTKLISSTATGDFTICVQARATIKAFEPVPAPYALAVTLELGQSVRQDLNLDVAARVRPKVQVGAPIPIRSRVRS